MLTRSHWYTLTAVTLPPLVLAAVGVSHPMELTAESAEYWRDMHIALLPVFPLLGLGPWLISRAQRMPLRWATAILGYAYAAFYGALDVLAGIGAGAVKVRTGDESSVQVLFDVGNALAAVGVYAYLAATVLAAGGSLLQARLAALPGAVLVVGAAVSFLDSHIYWPRGVVTMLLLAIGWAALAWATARPAVVRGPS